MGAKNYAFATKEDGTVVLANKRGESNSRYQRDQRKIEDWEIIQLIKIFTKQKCDELETDCFTISHNGKAVISIKMED